MRLLLGTSSRVTRLGDKAEREKHSRFSPLVAEIWMIFCSRHPGAAGFYTSAVKCEGAIAVKCVVQLLRLHGRCKSKSNRISLIKSTGFVGKASWALGFF